LSSLYCYYSNHFTDRVFCWMSIILGELEDYPKALYTEGKIIMYKVYIQETLCKSLLRMTKGSLTYWRLVWRITIGTASILFNNIIVLIILIKIKISCIGYVRALCMLFTDIPYVLHCYNNNNNNNNIFFTPSLAFSIQS